MSTSTIELFRNDMKFSVAHFTIFSATERERLHGHNYYVHSIISAIMTDGITYDYSITRREILLLCRSLNEYLLLPGKSPYLAITSDDTYYYVSYDKDKMQFLKSDTQILPIENVTAECLAAWFVAELTKDKTQLNALGIQSVCIKISTTTGQFASSTWGEK